MAGQDSYQIGDHSPADIMALSPVASVEQRRRKRRLVVRIIVFCLCLIPFFIWLQGRLFERDIQFPVNSNIVIFGLINLNVILLLVISLIAVVAIAALQLTGNSITNIFNTISSEL